MVTLPEMKAHLRVTTDADDALIAIKLAVAADWVSRYTAIPLDATDTPAPVSEATRMLAAHLYENREASLIGVTVQELPFGVLDMLAPFRAWAF